jgi:hypothetical protein
MPDCTPHRVASVRELRHCLLDETADVRQAGVGSARAARLDRRGGHPQVANKNKNENDFCDENHF